MKSYFVRYSIPQYAFGLADGEPMEVAMNRGSNESICDVIIHIDYTFNSSYEIQEEVASQVYKVLDFDEYLKNPENEDNITSWNIDPSYVEILSINLL